VAYVVAQADVAAAELAADLEQRCTRALSRYKRPAKVNVVEALPSGPTGKPRRGELRRLAALDQQTPRPPTATTVHVG
jgi:acyl-coenzyme A synthetase/AMP-(fatty) acid ligase